MNKAGENRAYKVTSYLDSYSTLILNAQHSKLLTKCPKNLAFLPLILKNCVFVIRGQISIYTTKSIEIDYILIKIVRITITELAFGIIA